MSLTDDDSFWARDHFLPMVTPDAVAAALDGFALALLPGRDIDWLAMAVRRSLAISIPNVSDGPERTSNAEINAELKDLASDLRKIWQKIFECSRATDDRLWTVAWRRWDGEGGETVSDGMVMGQPLEYRRFKAAVAEMDWLAGFMQLAAEETPSPQGDWRGKERKWIRITRGQFLAPIFEAAFGELVSANNYPNDARHASMTPFMDFYSRMVTLAFSARETTNLAEVVKEACKRHRQQPAQFADGLIPGL